MLPSGTLSKHGYKVTHGYFSGVCGGSGWPPFEAACDMLPGFLTGAERELARASKLGRRRSGARRPKILAWVHNYERANDGTSGYQWRQVAVGADVRPTYTRYSYQAPGYRQAKAGTIETSSRALDNRF